MKSVKTALAVLAVLSLLATANGRTATAKEIDLGWNVRNAANFMYAASQINKNAEGKNAIPVILEPYNLTYYRQWTERFKEDLGMLIAVNKSHVFVAFRGTTDAYPANEEMNNDGRPTLEYATRVHRGWWRAAEKAWKHEISKVLDDKLGDRKIVVTGNSMGGAVGAYVAKIMQKNRGKKKPLGSKTPLRLVTFGTPRYAFKKTFFSKSNTLIFIVEAAMNNGCVDKVVWDWQVNLRKTHPLYKKVDIQKPKRDKGTYYRRCGTNKTKQKDEDGVTDSNNVHSSSTYLEIARSKKCKYVKYKACSPYKKYVD